MFDTHAFIGTLAQALTDYDVPIGLSTLSKILHNKGAVPYRDDFDVGSIVAAAYAYWVSRNSHTARAIAYAFRDERGAMVIPANELPALPHQSQEA